MDFDTAVKTINKLLEKKNIAIISGETFKKCDFQVLSELPKSARLDHLILLPQSGTQCFQNKKGEWQEIYKYDLNKYCGIDLTQK